MTDNLGLGVNITGSSKGAVKAVNDTANSFKRLGTSTKGAADSMAKFYDKTRKTNNALNNIAKDANRSAEGLGKMSKAMNQMAGAGAIYMIANGLSKAIQSSMDMIETVNLFSVSMGDMALETQGFVVAMSDAFGFDQTNIQSAVGNFNLLARSMGFSTEQAQVLSTNTYKLGKDLASLTNVPINQVMQDLRSGLIGQTETVYKYGMDLTEASLGAEAVAQGIDKSVRSMSQGEKMALRYSLMLKQSTLAQGDFARTIESPANQLKVLSERFVTLGRAIGSMFIPLLTAILPFLNAFVKTLTGIFNSIATFFGYEPPAVSDMSGSFSGIEDGADASTDAVDDTTKAIKEMKTATLGIDELNLIPDTSASDSAKKKDSGAGDASILPDFKLPSYDDLMSTVKNKSDEIAKSMKKVWDGFLELSKPLMFANWESLKYSVGELGKALANLGKISFQALIWFYKEVLVPLGVWLIEKGLPTAFDFLAKTIDAVRKVLEALYPVFKYLINEVLIPVAVIIGEGIILAIENMGNAFKSAGDIISFVVKVFTGAFGSINKGFDDMNKNISNGWYNLWNGFKNSGKMGINGIIGIMNGLINGMEWMINGFIAGFNKMIYAIDMAKSAMGIAGWIYPIPTITLPDVPYLARGGQLDVGQAFIAGEAGAEMIGSYQGKTTVMPLENTGFVQAIHDAVLSAVTAGGDTGGKGTVIENVVNLDGQVIYTNQQKVSKERGKNFGMGVFAR